ncbi:hypothetical protein [Caballeronia sp. LZ001]|uniref:hypothetical protein n=1 Tax=Caballeronia sp. LZ001 TaxID=3038553 RepID=UPI0028663FB1|nr:hypothetical protein [Caballeronia sp. LZ001]MDR5806467.1 hypothetical protein [Caballeronia sp. LZ001]
MHASISYGATLAYALENGFEAKRIFDHSSSIPRLVLRQCGASAVGKSPRK